VPLIVERGLILEPYEVSSKTNEITALLRFIKMIALKGLVFAIDAIKKNRLCNYESSNHYIGALKGNQSGLLQEVSENFTPEQTCQLNKDMGSWKKHRQYLSASRRT